MIERLSVAIYLDAHCDKLPRLYALYHNMINMIRITKHFVNTTTKDRTCGVAIYDDTHYNKIPKLYAKYYDINHMNKLTTQRTRHDRTPKCCNRP